MFYMHFMVWWLMSSFQYMTLQPRMLRLYHSHWFYMCTVHCWVNLHIGIQLKKWANVSVNFSTLFHLSSLRLWSSTTMACTSKISHFMRHNGGGQAQVFPALVSWNHHKWGQYSRKPLLDSPQVALCTSFSVFSPVWESLALCPHSEAAIWARAVEK